MKELDIETLRELLDYNPDTGVLTWKVRDLSAFERPSRGKMWNTRYAGNTAGTINSRGYKQLRVQGLTLLAHRVVWAMHYGEWPEMFLDHVNGKTGDNRINNLREVSQQDNLKNMKLRSTSTSGVCGISWDKIKSKWEAYIHTEGKKKHLGRFTNKQEAIAARKAAEVKYGFHENHGRNR